MVRFQTPLPQKEVKMDKIIEFCIKFDEKGLRKWLEDMNLIDYYRKFNQNTD